MKWQADDVNTYAIACLLGPKEFKTVILVVDCVQSEVAKVVESQHSLERQLELIETHQQEVISLRSYIFSFLGVPCFESQIICRRRDVLLQFSMCRYWPD